MSPIARRFRPVRRTLVAAASLATVAVSAYACRDTSAPTGPRYVYGAPLAVGNGNARSYVVFDATGTKPLEIGVALTEAALEGLPAPMQMPAGTDPHAHVDYHEYLLPLPAQNPTPYRLVELDWNPGGHEPPGIYDIPHFDFHFYTINKSQRDAIDPTTMTDSVYLAMSASLPPQSQQAQFFVPLAAPGTPLSAVPHMGLHWSDVRSPELQGMLGHPENARTFTTTFIHGSWNGSFIFDEPMVTRAFIMGRKTATAAAARDSVIALPLAASAPNASYSPAAYHVTFDAKSGEYRIALSQLAIRQ